MSLKRPRSNARKSICSRIHTGEIIRTSLLITVILSVLQISWVGYNYDYDYDRSDELQMRNDRRDIHRAPPKPVVYKKIQEIPQFLSSGPNEAIKGVPGLYEFRNVCMARNIDDESLLGLVYFVPPNDTNVHENPSRCVPCRPFLMHGWDIEGADQEHLGHKCGYHNLHAMYATNVTDWSSCMKVQSHQGLIQTWWRKDPFSPPLLDTVHFYKEPMMSLVNNLNIGHSLWDHMLTYLPHWFIFRTMNDFPFDGVGSFSVENCLSDYTSQWYCSLLRAMDAFDGAPEVNMVPQQNSSVLNCFDRLLTPFLALPRLHRYSTETMPSREAFDMFRKVLFDKLDLPRPFKFRSQHMAITDSTAAQTNRVLFYSHSPSARRVWTNMDELLLHAQNQAKYKDWEFNSVYDFGALSIERQALLFNTHDVMIMVHGAQMANSIFAPDGSLFIEVGCRIPSFLNVETFLSLIDGRYGQVTSCKFSGEDSACLECPYKKRSDTESGGEVLLDPIYSNFTMTAAKFDLLLDEVNKLLPLRTNVTRFIGHLAT